MKNIEVKVSDKIKQRGVFAVEDFKKGEIVEICPLLLLPIEDMKHINKTKLKYYYFDLTKRHFAIVLGYGSLYNHSYKANARYILSARDKTMTIKAIENIKKGEEIFINYNWTPDDQTPLSTWFDPEFKDKSV